MLRSLLVGLLGLLLTLPSCTKLSDLQNAYLQYSLCTEAQQRFHSLDFVEPDVRVEVVVPIVVSPDGAYLLAGEVHYFDPYNQLLAIVTYGIGEEERWATKELFPTASDAATDWVEGSTICRFEQGAAASVDLR